MANDPDSSNQPSGDDAPEATGGRRQERAERRPERPNFFRTDHTPPPVTIENGSLLIETEERFAARDEQGGLGHRFRHLLNGSFSVQGWRILSDAGDTVGLDGDADRSSIKIWYQNPNGPEQIFIDGNTLTIEADAGLHGSIAITHPPVKRTRRRERQYRHPASGGAGVEILKVEVITQQGASTVFETNADIRLDKVYIWDTPDEHEPE